MTVKLEQLFEIDRCRIWVQDAVEEVEGALKKATPGTPAHLSLLRAKSYIQQAAEQLTEQRQNRSKEIENGS